MKFLTFLDNAATLEETISECYAALSDRAPGTALTLQFKNLAQEELNHAKVIKTGKNYAIKMPEIFGETIIDDSALQSGLTRCRTVRDEIRTGRLSLQAEVARLSELELEFEAIHMATIAEITDPTLVDLFKKLSHDDRDHHEILKEILLKLK